MPASICELHSKNTSHHQYFKFNLLEVELPRAVQQGALQTLEGGTPNIQPASVPYDQLWSDCTAELPLKQ